MIEWLANEVYRKLRDRVYSASADTVRREFQREIREVIAGVKGRRFTTDGAELGKAIDARVEKAMGDVVHERVQSEVGEWARYLSSEEFIDEIVDRINRKQLDV